MLWNYKRIDGYDRRAFHHKVKNAVGSSVKLYNIGICGFDSVKPQVMELKRKKYESENYQVKINEKKLQRVVQRFGKTIYE